MHKFGTFTESCWKCFCSAIICRWRWMQCECKKSNICTSSFLVCHWHVLCTVKERWISVQKKVVWVSVSLMEIVVTVCSISIDSSTLHHNRRFNFVPDDLPLNHLRSWVVCGTNRLHFSHSKIYKILLDPLTVYMLFVRYGRYRIFVWTCLSSSALRCKRWQEAKVRLSSVK